MQRWDFRTHGAIALILAVFLLLGVAYSVVNPLHEATDELRHYRFARSLVENRALPVQGEEPCRSQSHHPPLYYALGALLTGWIDTGQDVCFTPPENPFWQYRYWDVGVDNKNQYLPRPETGFPWQGEALAAHLLRLLNLLFGAITVWFTWATGRSIWPRRPGLAAAGAAFVAFNPMFLYLSAAINNDIVAAAAGAALSYALARLVLSPAGLTRRAAVGIGVVYGLGLLSKTSVAGFALPIALAATYVAYRRRSWRQWVEGGLIMVGVALLVSGWWFARNLIVYGDPTGFQRLTELWGVRDPRESLPLVLTELPYAWSSLWGRFGFGQIPLPAWFYAATRWLVALGLLSWPLSLLVQRGRSMRERRRQPPELSSLLNARGAGSPPVIVPPPVAVSRPRAVNAALLLLLLMAATAFAVWFNYMLLSPAGPMGRFFFPGLPALGLLLGAGYARWGGPRGRLDGVAALLLNGVLAAAALWALVDYLAPAYSRPPEWPALGAAQSSDVSFDGLVALRGYELAPMRLQPGDPLTLTLYWEVTAPPPGNYLFFVHLTDDSGALIAQRDTHPGLGNFPSSQWEAGDRFVERIALYVPTTAYVPATAQISIGLYAPEGYRLGIRDGAGRFLGDALPLGEVVLEEPAGAFRNPQAEKFADLAILRGYAYERRVVAPGTAVELDFYWERLTPANDLTVRVELLDEGGNLRARAFGPVPAAPAGDTVTVGAVLNVPADLAPGTYEVRLALIDDTTGRILPRLGTDGREIGQDLPLAPVRVPDPAAPPETGIAGP